MSNTSDKLAMSTAAATLLVEAEERQAAAELAEEEGDGMEPLPSRRTSSTVTSSSTMSRTIDGNPEGGGHRRGHDTGRGFFFGEVSVTRGGGGSSNGNGSYIGDGSRTSATAFMPPGEMTPAAIHRRNLASQLARQRLKKAARYAGAGLAVAPPFVAKVSAGEGSLEGFLSSSGVDWKR